MKQFLTIMLCLTMVLALASCGQTQTQVSTSPSPTETSPSPSQTPDVDNSPSESQTPSDTASPEDNGAADVGTPETEKGKTLVIYYSATGYTEEVAGYIAGYLGADTFEIVPADVYTSDDLNWRDEGSRVTLEHEDPSLRTLELVSTSVEGWDDYDTVFIG